MTLLPLMNTAISVKTIDPTLSSYTTKTGTLRARFKNTLEG